MKPPVKIPPTERLMFRLMSRDDADLLFELDQDPEVMRFLNDSKPTPREEIDRYFIPRMEKFTDPEAGCGLWAVLDRSNGEYLGWILVRIYGTGTTYKTPGNIELGWRLYRHCWGKGIATEAAAAIMEVLRHRDDVKVFSAIADVDNFGSIGVMKKLGMQFVDERTHVTPKGDLPVAYYEIAAQ